MHNKVYKIWSVVLLLALFTDCSLYAMEKKYSKTPEQWPHCALFGAFMKQAFAIKKTHTKGSWDRSSAETLLALYDQMGPCNKGESCPTRKAMACCFQNFFGIGITEARQRIADDGEKEPPEPDTKNKYIVFEYEGETDSEPDNLFTELNQKVSQMPYQDPYKKNQDQKNDMQKKRNDSWLAVCSSSKKDGMHGKAGMTVNPRKYAYNWYHCSDKIPGTCFPRENIGLRGMWIGCLGNPDEVEIRIISLIWVLIHGTWGHSTPSFYDDNNENFKEIQACIAEQAKGESALLLSHKWSGENTVKARKKAARRLKQCLKEMQLLKNNTILVIVSHSHGCNVASRFSQLLDKDRLNEDRFDEDGLERIAMLIYFACPRRPEKRFQPKNYDNLLYFWGTNDLVASLGSICWDDVKSNVEHSRIFMLDQISEGIAGGLKTFGCNTASPGVKLLGKLQLGKAIYYVYQVVIRRAKSPHFPDPEKDNSDENAKDHSIRIGTNVNIRGFDLLGPVTIHSYIVNILHSLRSVFQKFEINNYPTSGSWKILMNNDGSDLELEEPS